MPILTAQFYELMKQKQTNIYIETGCYRGEGVKEVLQHYKEIHSIELSEKWFNYNIEQFKNNHNVKIHLGDSKNILPKLLLEMDEPVTIYLDAHYSGKFTSFGEEETPLLFELEILKNRIYDDIIIIDDCRLLGKSGVCGGDTNDLIYPRMFFDWSNITIESINALLKSNYKIIDNLNRQYSTGASDQLILVKDA